MSRFVLWLVPSVEKFPRRQKSLLGDRLQATALDALEAGRSSAGAGEAELTDCRLSDSGIYLRACRGRITGRVRPRGERLLIGVLVCLPWWRTILPERPLSAVPSHAICRTEGSRLSPPLRPRNESPLTSLCAVLGASPDR